MNDPARAERIAELKAQHPLLTWRKIAETVGVTERAVQRWPVTGSLKPEHAETLASLFGVDFDYIWRGPRAARADALEQQLADASEALRRIADTLDAIRLGGL